MQVHWNYFKQNKLKKVLQIFYINKTKLVCTSLASNFKLSKKQSSKFKAKCEQIERTPYASTIENLMHIMISTRFDIAHAMRVVSTWVIQTSIIGRWWNGSSNTWEKQPTSTLLLEIQGYIDFDLARYINNRRNTTNYFFILGNMTISWTVTKKLLHYRPHKLNKLQLQKLTTFWQN